MPDIKESFKNFRQSQGIDNGKKITEAQKQTLKSHIIISEGFNDYDLVQLVMFYNGHEIENPYIEKFKSYNYINENKKFTKEGVEFLKLDETISKIKKIIAES